MKRALVTGASGGIGQVIAKQLAADGFEVIAHASSSTAAVQNLVTTINADGGSAMPVNFDVCDQAATRDALGELLEHGAIEVIVNNAGIHDDMIMAGMSYEQWHKVIDVNLNGFFNVTQPLLLPMLRKRWGRIVNISSISGVMGNAGQVNYSAAKAGLHGATMALAREVASRGVTVNAVAPGLIATPMTDGIFNEEQIKQMVPMKRAGKPDEVAALVGFLCSDAASYISSQVISVNGGMF